MLTAHQRLAIRTRLPEVVDVYVREDRGIVDLSIVRLRLADSEITIYGIGDRRCRRHRLVGDYSERIEILPIDQDLCARLVSVFGPLIFGPECDAQ